MALLAPLVFGGVFIMLWRFYVVTLLFGLFCGCIGFCHGIESDLFLFLFKRQYMYV